MADPIDTKKVIETADKIVDEVESQLISFAENIGWFAGIVQNRAEALLDREKLGQQVTRIRDGAADLLKKMNATREATMKKAAKSAKKAKPSRGAVDAPGKKHRKPPPQEKVKRGMGAPASKKMGKQSQTSRRGGQGRGRG